MYRMIYAEPDDLPADLQELDDVDRRIAAASDIVSWLTRGAVYPVNEEGYPSDLNLHQLFTEATVQQVIFADDKYGGVDVDEENAPAQLGSLRFYKDEGSSRNPNWGTGIRQNVSPAVWYMLFNAGLIRGPS